MKLLVHGRSRAIPMISAITRRTHSGDDRDVSNNVIGYSAIRFLNAKINDLPSVPPDYYQFVFIYLFLVFDTLENLQLRISKKHKHRTMSNRKNIDTHWDLSIRKPSSHARTVIGQFRFYFFVYSAHLY